jgi:hypothetical protein
MTKNEALKIAIEALDTLMIEKGSIYQQALNACKEALEQERKQFNFDAQFDSGVINND